VKFKEGFILRVLGNKSWLGIFVMVLILTLLVVAGCGGSTEKNEVKNNEKSAEQGNEQSQGQQQSDKVLVVAVDPDYLTFDPGRAYEMYATMVFNAIYDTLVRFEGKDISLPQPALATDWNISSDGKTYIFNLRPNINFNSGNPMTAKDVKWSFERIKNLKGTPSFMAKNIVDIKIIDDLKVQIVLEETDAAFLSKLARAGNFAVLDSETLKLQGAVASVDADQKDTAQGWLDNHSAGTGPFILTKYIPNDEVVLERNDDYWQGPAPVAKIIIKDIPDTNMQKLMLQRGDIDIAFNLTSVDVEDIKTAKGINLTFGSSLDLTFLFMNMDPKIGGPVANPKVQQAIRYAIDYEGLKILAGNNAIIPVSIIQVGFLGALEPFNPSITNIEKAKALLKEAGYENGFSIELQASTYATSGVQWVLLGQKIQNDLEKIGIKVTLETSDLSVSKAGYLAGEIGFGIRGWGPDYPDALNQFAFLPGQTVGKRVNWTEEMDPEIADLGKKAMVELNDSKRAELIEQIQQLTFERGPYAALVQPGRVVAVREGVTGAHYLPTGLLDLYRIDK